jgi:hypothetical protein
MTCRAGEQISTAGREGVPRSAILRGACKAGLQCVSDRLRCGKVERNRPRRAVDVRGGTLDLDEGELTDAERDEYDDYLQAFHLIGILQRKAMRVFANGAHA